MTTSIFIKTFEPDYKWLEYALRSIDKYGEGFEDIVIVAPPNCPEFKSKFKVRIVHASEGKRGYLQQQAIKMEAYKHTQSDFILFTDSDTIFNKPFSPDSFQINNKPYVLMEHYDKLPSILFWKNITQKCLGFDVQYEFMRRQPFFYRRNSVYHFQKWFLEKTGTSLYYYIMTQPQNCFSEYNALGAWVYQFEQEQYQFINVESGVIPEAVCQQFQIYSGVGKPTKEMTTKDVITLNSIV